MSSIWHSWHFYPLETLDLFLTRAVQPFLAQYIWPRQGARAFFVRYDDERGPHIRLRLRAEAEWMEETLQPAVEGWFRERGTRLEVPYQPEAERFGSEQALAWAEDHFHISTRVALDRMSQPTYVYGDALYDALRCDVIAAFAAGFSRERAAWYFGQLYAQWLPLFFSTELVKGETAPFAALEEQFQAGYERQRDDLGEMAIRLWQALHNKRWDDKQPEWVRWLHGNEIVLKGLGENMDRALPSLLHLHHNRLGIQNAEEVYLCYLLARLLG